MEESDMEQHELTPLERALLEEETKERQKEIRRMLRREDHTLLKAIGRGLGWAAGAAALFFGGIAGINYALNERSFTRYDGIRVESHVDGWFGHTRLEIGRNNDVTVWRCSPFERITSRAYTDEDGDGRVEYVWIGLQSDPRLGMDGRIYTRDEPFLNFDDADRIFSRELERFGYRRDGPDPQ